MCPHHQYVVTGFSHICTGCGIEKTVLLLDRYNQFSAPLSRTYERKTRFRNKVERLLGLSFPMAHDPVWGVLEKVDLKGPGCIRKVLRQSKLKNKHYDCIRVFSDVFTKFRVNTYDPHQLMSILTARFKKVHEDWVRCRSRGFFSYDWLLRLFLEQLTHPLLAYLKPATSRRSDTLKQYE